MVGDVELNGMGGGLLSKDGSYCRKHYVLMPVSSENCPRSQNSSGRTKARVQPRCTAHG